MKREKQTFFLSFALLLFLLAKNSKPIPLPLTHTRICTDSGWKLWALCWCQRAEKLIIRKNISSSALTQVFLFFSLLWHWLVENWKFIVIFCQRQKGYCVCLQYVNLLIEWFNLASFYKATYDLLWSKDFYC